jgi:predicted regulator of Ras-like GTPase activity (Roadblock/LC7/MglB family)
MVLQETFGEFDSTERLRALLKLICQLPGTYEILIKADNGEEGIVHCANEMIKNAAYRNLSGIEALVEILSWDAGKYWLEELPVIPIRTINVPLEKLFAEVEKIISPPAPSLPTSQDKSEETTDPSEQAPPTEDPVVPSEEKSPTDMVATEKEGGADTSETPAATAEPIAESPEAEESPAATPDVPTNEAVADLPHRIASIKGVKGLIVVSVDGILLSSVDIEPGEDQVQMVALLGQALEQIGELFGKGRFTHGAIDMISDRILIHTFHQSFVGTFIGSNVSAAMVGSQIERLIEEEPAL